MEIGPLEKNGIKEDKSFTHLSRAPKAKIRPGLRELTNTLNQSDLVDVRIRVVDDHTLEHVWQRLDRQIGLGNVKVYRDFDDVRTKIMDDRRRYLAETKKPIEDILKQWKVQYVPLENLNFIHAKVPVSRITALERLTSVHSLSVSHQITMGSINQCPIGAGWLDPGGWISGVEVVQGTQIQQLLCNSAGGQPPAGAYRVAVFEEGVPWNAANLLDWANGPSRLINPKGCGYFYCNNADVNDIDEHSTKVINLLAGDIPQNQQSNITVKKEQVQRSGYSPEAEIYAYRLENGTASFETAVNHLLSRSPLPLAASSSWGITQDNWFHDCKGDWDEDEALNSMYEAGIFPVVLAGNTIGTGNCNIWIPGAAVGAFTVGGHLYNYYSVNDGIAGVRTGDLYFKSSYGEENGRNVVEITAPSVRLKNPFGFTYPGLQQLWNDAVEGTSYSTPTVTAAATDFADFYETNYSTWIRNPGALFSIMLLMGDRQTNSGSKTNVGFDPQWGGGRMLMRMFNGAGMDTPWSWGRYAVCVDHNKEVSFDLFIFQQTLIT